MWWRPTHIVKGTVCAEMTCGGRYTETNQRVKRKGKVIVPGQGEMILCEMACGNSILVTEDLLVTIEEVETNEVQKP